MTEAFLTIKLTKILKEKILNERDRWILWIPVGLGLGILAYFNLTYEPVWWGGLIGILFSSIGLILLRLLKINNLAGWFVALACFIVFAGFTAAQVRTHSLKTYLFNYPSRVQTITGEIKKIEQMTTGLRLTLKAVSLSPIKLKHALSSIRITFKGKLAHQHKVLVPGQKVKFKGVLLPPNAPVAPGAYDFRKRAFFEQISAVGYGVTAPVVLKDLSSHDIKDRIVVWITCMRHALTSYLKETIGGSEGAIAAALITGDRSGISEDLRQNFANSGLAHVLAISGLHLSIVAGIAFLVLRKGLSFIPFLALRYPIKKWAAAFAIILTFFYLVLCDFAIPAQRAFLMTVIVLLAIITDRTALTMRNVALAAIVILLLLPESLISPSFQMSFSAVIALVGGYEIFREFLEKWRTGCRQWWQILFFYLLGITFSTILATIATTPYIIYTFNRFTLHALPANILCIPLLSFILMPLLILYLIISLFTSGPYLALALKKIVGLMIQIASTVSAWPGSTLLVPAVSSSLLLLFTGGFLWLFLWKTRWRRWGIFGPLLAVLLCLFQQKPDIFLAGDKNLICLLDTKGKGWVNSLQTGKFSRETWLKMVALQDVNKFSQKDEETSQDILVTDTMIQFLKEGKVITIYPDAQGEEEGLARSDLTILPAMKSPASFANVVTGYDLHKKGGHFIWITKKAIKIRTVQDDVGTRPWGLKIIK